jgi:hypothetical protein
VPNPQELYLDLLVKTLSFSLWPEPPAPVDPREYVGRPIRRRAVEIVTRALGSRNFVLSRARPITPEQRENGQFHPSYAHTMIGLKRLRNLQFCVETALNDNVPGDFIEAGVWRGGACILMRAILAARGVTDRRVFLADSFRGLPEPDAEKYPVDRDDPHHLIHTLAVSRTDVEANFRQFGFLDEQVVFLEGWFKDTLPSAPIDKLAILRLDGDMYESTMEIFENLYSKLSPGGFCIVDDYSLPNCKQAVEDFRARDGISAPLEVIDYTGRFWRK